MERHEDGPTDTPVLECPTSEALDEAQRATHNYLAQYWAIGELDKALRVYHAARQTTDQLQAQRLAVEEDVAATQARATAVQRQLDTLETDYATLRAVVEEEHQAVLTALQAERLAAEQALEAIQTALVEAQAALVVTQDALATEQAAVVETVTQARRGAEEEMRVALAALDVEKDARQVELADLGSQIQRARQDRERLRLSLS